VAWLGVVCLASTGISLGASAWLVSSLDVLAIGLSLPEAAVGFLVALAADAPEIVSAAGALASGHRSVGAGVALGSMSFNLAAIAGVTVLVAGSMSLSRRNTLLWAVLAVGTVGLAASLVLAGLPPIAGLLVGAALLAIAFSRHGKGDPVEDIPLPGTEARPRRASWGLGLKILGLTAVVVVSSLAMEQTATRLGTHFKISHVLIGGLALAGATSLPDAVGAMYLGLRGRAVALLGEAAYSNAILATVALALPASFSTLGHLQGSTELLAWFALGMTIGVFGLALATRALSRWAAGLVVMAYLALVALLIAGNSPK
jgi:Ca2+/Na+ antiporter